MGVTILYFPSKSPTSSRDTIAGIVAVIVKCPALVTSEKEKPHTTYLNDLTYRHLGFDI